RLLQQEEPWERSAGSPRLAAVSSFGFGGNNAHVLIEEFTPGLSASTARRPAPRRVAVVGMAVRAADGESTDAFESAFLSGSTRIRRQSDGTLGASAQEVRLPSSGLIFPPRDLERTLTQQTLLLEVTGEVMEGAVGLCGERTAVLIGMSCDAETTRSILRAVLPDLLPVEEIGHIALAQREAAMDVGFDAARVVGCMPNIPANRLNRQFDLGGPSFTIAAEELSGIRAIETAVDALLANEIDAAIVGASDMCVEPVHRSALSELPEDRRIPGDGACVLILKRVETAVRDNDRIRCILDLSPADEGRANSSIGPRLRDCFGHVHAMSGLFEVAAATVLMDRRIEFSSQMACVPVLPDSEVRPIQLRIDALGGQSTVVQVGPREPNVASTARVTIVGSAPDIHTYAAPDIAGLIRALDSGRPCKPVLTEPEQHRLSIVAAADDLRERLRLARTFLNRVEAGEISDSMSPEGIFFRRSPVEGDLAFVFTGGSAAYTGMGRGLLLAMPKLDPGPSKADWAYRSLPEQEPSDFQRLCGSSFLCQVHARFTQEILGLRPQAAIGLSSGETNSMYALGAWQGMGGLLHDIEECGLYTNVLGGKADAIREDWFERGIEGGSWSNHWILAPLHEVQAAVALEPSVHITIINTQNDVVIGGDSSACQRVVEQIGTRRCSQLGGDFAAHCPEVRRVADLWRRLHLRPTIQPRGITYYSNALGRSYHLSDDSVADALTLQALETVDFPRTIQTAWDDGVRIFVEHGPRSQCTQSIRSILGGRQFVAVPLDLASRPSLTQAMYAAAELWTTGVKVDIDGLRSAIGFDRQAAAELKNVLRLPAHPIAPDAVLITPAPTLALLTETDEAVAAYVSKQENAPTPGFVANPEAVVALHDRISSTHQDHLRQMARLDQAYQETQGRLLQLIGGRPVAVAVNTRTFTREQLEVHASGRISEIFGPAFAAQDDFVRQVRMPTPPLLLADRVTALTGEPGSMGMGSITTETDILPGAWYLNRGRMPAGIMVEAGQADLMLISWLGVDNHNKGQRVYRLLGCDLSYHGELPRAGETLRYEIRIASHAVNAGVRIFFFDYDCTSAGSLRLSVRNAHAGFFTDEELAASEGVLWSATTGAHTPAEQARLDPPLCLTPLRSFGPSAVQALAASNLADCFGDGFELAYTHSRTPLAQFGQMQFLERIPVFDPGGGPWKRGYLRAEWDVRPDEWFFKGHFKNDPCMPGTLMVEGCLQAMAFYLTAQGFTLNRDGWRFE
ncbi:MAG TPA: beta-ketoacyl synthase N-terminal-like domain-containing protein, partial [Bryobacteraceae bacterium]|nr:beta-ketoacyl synthase N-terminal-like domain-containing protein [Bryobacteraceae bacterium]